MRIGFFPPRWRAVLLMTLAASIAACGGSSVPGPLPVGPMLACPADIVRGSPDGRAVVVTYDVPQAVGGTGPITLACTPPPDSSFGIGSTMVMCTATDARGLSAACTFAVVIARQLAATRFLAFGDSLTVGETSASPTVLLWNIPDSYPYKLQRLLAARHPTQTIDVLNDGVGGERAAAATQHSPGGVKRLPSSLDEHHPEVLLLMEGSNDLSALESGAQAAIDALEDMVRLAKGRGLRVLLATIPPQRAGGARNIDSRITALIPGFNEEIRQVAAREGAVLVDVYDALKDRLNLIGIDDLHPTPQGYDVIAATFFDAIEDALEVRGLGAAR